MKLPLANIEVDLSSGERLATHGGQDDSDDGGDGGHFGDRSDDVDSYLVKKVNLTLHEGESLTDTVATFCSANMISGANIRTIENALKARVPATPLLELLIGRHTYMHT
jgi:hypothetical protein